MNDTLQLIDNYTAYALLHMKKFFSPQTYPLHSLTLFHNKFYLLALMNECRLSFLFHSSMHHKFGKVYSIYKSCVVLCIIQLAISLSTVHIMNGRSSRSLWLGIPSKQWNNFVPLAENFGLR